MIECLLLLAALLRTAVCDRAELVAENLLLRQQLGVLTRPTRKRPRLRARDKLFWLLARLAWRDWRWHLVLVSPEARDVGSSLRRVRAAAVCGRGLWRRRGRAGPRRSGRRGGRGRAGR